MASSQKRRNSDLDEDSFHLEYSYESSDEENMELIYSTERSQVSSLYITENCALILFLLIFAMELLIE